MKHFVLLFSLEALEVFNGFSGRRRRLRPDEVLLEVPVL